MSGITYQFVTTVPGQNTQVFAGQNGGKITGLSAAPGTGVGTVLDDEARAGVHAKLCLAKSPRRADAEKFHAFAERLHLIAEGQAHTIPAVTRTSTAILAEEGRIPVDRDALGATINRGFVSLVNAAQTHAETGDTVLVERYLVSADHYASREGIAVEGDFISATRAQAYQKAYDKRSNEVAKSFGDLFKAPLNAKTYGQRIAALKQSVTALNTVERQAKDRGLTLVYGDDRVRESAKRMIRNWEEYQQLQFENFEEFLGSMDRGARRFAEDTGRKVEEFERKISAAGEKFSAGVERTGQAIERGTQVLLSEAERRARAAGDSIAKTAESTKRVAGAILSGWFGGK